MRWKDQVPEGYVIYGSYVINNKAEITITVKDFTKAGSYPFTVLVDSDTSDDATLVVGAPPAVKREE